MTATDSTKHQKSKALKPGSRRPAKELCSECGLCDTYYIHYVKESCAFLTQHIAELEAEIHGRSRNLDNPDDWYFGVSQNMMAARKKEPIEGAQWTGIVSTIAIEMLEKGIVEGVVCVQNTKEDRFQPDADYCEKSRRNSGSKSQQTNSLSQSFSIRTNRKIGDEAAVSNWRRLSNSSLANSREKTRFREALRFGNSLRG
jgi:hypothetical protein